MGACQVTYTHYKLLDYYSINLCFITNFGGILELYDNSDDSEPEDHEEFLLRRILGSPSSCLGLPSRGCMSHWKVLNVKMYMIPQDSMCWAVLSIVHMWVFLLSEKKVRGLVLYYNQSTRMSFPFAQT